MLDDTVTAITVKTFPVQGVCMYKASHVSKSKDINQFFSAEALETTTLSFDQLGRIYLNKSMCHQFLGVTQAAMKSINHLVIVSVSGKNGFTFEVYVASTIDDIVLLRAGRAPGQKHHTPEPAKSDEAAA